MGRILRDGVCRVPQLARNALRSSAMPEDSASGLFRVAGFFDLTEIRLHDVLGYDEIAHSNAAFGESGCD